MDYKLTVGSMFAGVGGICKAFENAGYKLKWANEYDAKACITYRKNFKHKLIEGDVHEIKDPKNEAGIVDVITSGFPCQAFSIAGYRNGFDDPRGNLFFETARFIDEIQPKAFLLENVKNLYGHDKGNTIRVIKDTIKNELKYSYIPFILNSKNYGNIPQNRERIYIVGFKDEEGFESFYDKKIPEPSLFDEMNRDYFFSSRFKIPAPIKLTKTIHDVIDKDRKDQKYYYEGHKYYPMLKEAMKNRDTIYQWRRVYVRENQSNVCPTLTANMGTGGHNVPLIIDDFGFRKLTPRECFRFQGYPNDFILPEMNNSALYKQAGNSVVVPVVERIAKEIKRVLDLRK